MKPTIASLLLVLTSCGTGPTGVDGSCHLALFANDNVYVPIDEFVDGSAVSENPAFTVIRYDPECYDQGEPHQMINGESNFLPVGTPIHRVDGFGPLGKLAYWDDDWQSWRPLVPPLSCPAKTEGQSGLAEPPCEG